MPDGKIGSSEIFVFVTVIFVHCFFLILLALLLSIAFDYNSAVIGSNLAYVAIHQLGGQAGKNKKTTIPARPYLKLTDDNFEEILNAVENFF